MASNMKLNLAAMSKLLDGCVGVLTQYSGRDKAMSAANYALMFFADKIECVKTSEKLMAMAKQISAARLVARQFGDLPLIKANLAHLANRPKSDEDRVIYDLQMAVNLLYSLYMPIEHVAWLSDLKLLPFESSRWFKYSLYVSTAALTVSIARSALMFSRIRQRLTDLDSEVFRDEDARKRLKAEEKDEFLNLVSLTGDFLNAVNFLPFKGFLWAQSFPAWKTGLIGFIASCSSLIKIFRTVH